MIRAALALCVAVAACGPPVGKDGKPMTLGRLRLRTFPPGAQVWIDGQLKVEATPATLILPAGKYRLRLQLEGAMPLEQDLEIEAGDAREIDLDLPRPPEAALTIMSDAVGAKVSVNGYTRGTTPLLRAVTKPGAVDVTVLTFDGRAKSVRGVLLIGEHKYVQVFFEPVECLPPPPPKPPPPPMSVPPPLGFLTLGLEPDGQVIDEDDQVLGKTPLERLPLEPGAHRLLLKSGKRQRWIEVEIEEGKSAIYRFRLLPEDEAG